MPKRLYLTIEGERGALPLETFAAIIRSAFDILSDLDSAISSNPQGSLRWFLADISLGSLAIAIESKSKLERVDHSLKVAKTFVDGLAQIQQEHTTPPYFSDYGLRKAHNLARMLGKDGAKALRVEDPERHALARIEPEIAASLNQLLGVRYREIGSVEGTLEMISIHGAPRFTVYHAITQRSVRCNFGPRLLDMMKDALGRRAIVSGTVYRNYVHEPVRVNVEKLTILPKEDELPSPKDLRGMAPDFTGNQETGDYLRSLRSG